MLLGLRMEDGLTLDVLGAEARGRLSGLADRDLIRLDADRIRLTVTGRLLADAVVRDLTE